MDPVLAGSIHILRYPEGMAQDPEGEQASLGSGDVDVSHQTGMVKLFESMNTDAELDAENIRGVLESNGVEAVIERSSPYPNFGVIVMVAQSDLERAKSLVGEALAAGPEAAADAESETEQN